MNESMNVSMHAALQCTNPGAPSVISVSLDEDQDRALTVDE